MIWMGVEVGVAHPKGRATQHRHKHTGLAVKDSAKWGFLSLSTVSVHRKAKASSKVGDLPKVVKRRV